MVAFLPRRISAWLQSDTIESVIRQIVDASLETVCERVQGEVRPMSLSETRGYVRARSADVVGRYSRIVMAGKRFDTLCQQQVRRAATERLIPLVMRRIERIQVQRVLHRAAA